MGKTMRQDVRITIAGLILSVAGKIGGFFGLYGLGILWTVLSIVGLIPAFVYVWKTATEWREVVKTFGKRWSLKEGQLVIGNTVNVALRAKTVQEIIDALQKAEGEDYASRIRSVGRAIGESFADDLKKELVVRGIGQIIKPGRKPGLLRDKLNLWAEYDSSTGMGIFDISQVKISSTGVRGYILVRGSFLAYDRQSDSPTCLMLEGYLEGVITKLLSMCIHVRETECSAVMSSDCCKFEVTSL